jgi:2-amino-4-hydroxy-6-hydroxymethyldihydropteridine diphosphokinase
LGDRFAALQAGLDQLAKVVRWDRVSPVYETPPMYVLDQPAFYNAVAAGVTDLGPLALLAELKRVERHLGRQVRTQNGPREIDLDLLAYDGLVLRSGARLIVPHARIAERRFVLQPWADLDPAFVIPDLGPVGELLAQTNDPTGCVKEVADAILSI